MHKLTVFTPTYNRANLLVRGYDALCRQTSTDFCWLIIDDGSTDSTSDLVKSWLSENSLQILDCGFEGYSNDAQWLHIRYYYKENGGLHTGYNKAIELMDTELCVCVDSDDYMPDNGVEIILEKWQTCIEKGLIGVIGRDFMTNGQLIGTPLPKVESATITELMDKYQHKGDKKIAMKVDLLKQLKPMPTFNGEKNFNPIYLMLQLDQFGKYLLIEDNLCFVDYQDTGMAANIYKQFVNSPNSFCALRSLYLSLPKTTWRFKLKNLIHLSSRSFLAHNLTWMNKSKYPLLAYIFSPIGFLMSIYIKHKAK
jgi:glycosyltransferase involved in cell wall biosynthesis